MNMQITNRELLRNYRNLKEKLLNGEVDSIVVPQGSGIVVKLTIEKNQTPFERMTKMILANPFKNIKRTEEDII